MESLGYKLRLKQRTDVPAWLGWGAPPFTVIAALVVGSTAFIAVGVDPIAAYTEMFRIALTTPGGLSEVVIRTVPLALAGLAVYLPLKAGLWNIAAEGQIFIGGIMAAWVGLSVDAPAVVLLPLMIGAGALAGGVLGLIPGYLRARYDVNEIIVTLLITFIAIQLNEYAIQALQGEFQLHGSARLSDAARFPTFFGTRVHLGVVFVAIAVVGVYLLVKKTKFGFEIEMVGSNPDVSVQAGINKERVFIVTMVLGGIMAGIAGVGEIAGLHGRLQPEFSPGYGFTAIAIALLGQRGPFQVLLASAFFGTLFVGGLSLQAVYSINFAVVEILVALVILFLITSEFFKRFEVDLERMAEEGS